MSTHGTASVLTARALISALDDRHIDADSVLRAAGLSRQALESVEHRVPYANMRRLWEAAAAATGDRSIGLHVAENRGPCDLFEYLTSASATLGEGLARLTRYIRIFYDQANLQLVIEPSQARLVRRVALPSPQYEEFMFTWLLVHSRRQTGVEWAPESVTFQHERQGDDSELKRVFRCSIEFSAPSLEMRFPRAILDLPNIHPDSRLLTLVMRYADTLLPTPAGDDPVASVASLIARQLTTELPTLSSTAAAMRIPERTLQRRLAGKGVHYSALVDDVRRGLAMRFIADPTLAVGEIAYQLHFADASAFQRAFKRWTGETPGQYRKRLFERAPEARLGARL